MAITGRAHLSAPSANQMIWSIASGCILIINGVTILAVGFVSDDPF